MWRGASGKRGVWQKARERLAFSVVRKRAKEVESMLNRFGDRRFYDPLREINRQSEQMFGGVMRPAEGTQQVPTAVGT